MRGGRTSKTLRADQIRRLETFRIGNRLSIPMLNAAIGGRGMFTWQVLRRALQGKPIWEFNYQHIVQWIESHLPAEPAGRDGKALAAGEKVQA